MRVQGAIDLQQDLVSESLLADLDDRLQAVRECSQVTPLRAGERAGVEVGGGSTEGVFFFFLVMFLSGTTFPDGACIVGAAQAHTTDRRP